MAYLASLLILLMSGLPLRTFAGSPQCPVPDIITGASRTYTGCDYGDTVTYKCYVGYVLSNGTETLTCDGTGSWNGTLPTCTDVDDYFSFSCNTSGEIVAINPDPTSIIWNEAHNDDGLCNTTFTAGNTSVIITGCPIDKPIELVFSPYPEGIPNLVKGNVKFYNITCLTIPKHGINVMVTDNTWVRNLARTSREPQQALSFALESNLIVADAPVDILTTAPTTNATGLAINDKLLWRIVIPEPYIVYPMNCTARSGKIGDGDFQYSIEIIEMGCSLDITLMSDFRHLDENTTYIAVADLYAFRFPGSNEVEVFCVVKACPPGSSSCDWTCDNRKKRSEPYTSGLDAYTAQKMEENDSDSRQKRYVGTDDLLSARISFRVYGPPNVGLEYLRSCSLKHVSQWSAALAFTFYVMVRKMCF